MQTDTQGAAANTQLALARDFVVKYFVAIDRQDLARLVDQGDGDDFPELQAAAALLSEHSALIDRLRAALVEYAAADFWDDSLPGGPLALHDAGEMARNVLSGRPHFFHRD